MLHDLPSHQQALSDYWQKELDSLLHALAQNYDIVALEQVIGRPVMMVL
jgi:hypothetical protein